MDLQKWEPPATVVDWVVAIEFLEHLHYPAYLARIMFAKARYGVVVTTPNSDVVNTLARDDDHVTGLTDTRLRLMGFQEVKALPLFTKVDDTLVAWRTT